MLICIVSLNDQLVVQPGGRKRAAAEQLGKAGRNEAELRGDLGIVHARRADHTDQAPHIFARVIRCEYDAAVAQLLGHILRTDEHAHLVVAAELLHRDVEQVAAVGQVAHEAVRLVGVAELRLVQQLRLADEVRLRGACAREHLDREGRDHGRDAEVILRGALRRADQHRGDVALMDAREVGVEDGGEFLDHALVGRDRQVHELVFHRIVAQKQDDDEAVRVEINEVEAADRHAGARRERHGGVIGQLRGEAARVRHELAALMPARQALRDGLRLLRGEVLVLHELVDVHPVAERCGHAARRCVRLLEIAHGDQLRQLVADRGRGTAEIRARGDGLRADRLCRADVFLDDRGKYFLFAAADVHDLLRWHSELPTVGTPDLRVLIYTPPAGKSSAFSILLIDCS